jgi:hypothetical protein
LASPHFPDTHDAHASTPVAIGGLTPESTSASGGPASPASGSASGSVAASFEVPESPASTSPHAPGAVDFVPPVHVALQSVAHFPHVRASLHAANAAYAARASTPPSGVPPASAVLQKHCVREPSDSPKGLLQARSATHRLSVKQTAHVPVHSCVTHEVHAGEDASPPPSNTPESSSGASFVRTVHPGMEAKRPPAISALALPNTTSPRRNLRELIAMKEADRGEGLDGARGSGFNASV